MTAGTRGLRLTVAALVALAGVTACGLHSGARLNRDGAMTVVTPEDGATVGGGVLVAWARGGHQGSFAVDLDDAVPAPGAQVDPSPTVVVTATTALHLTFSPRSGGSPTARDWHRVVVIPLDTWGRREGEDVAVVHLRSGG